MVLGQLSTWEKMKLNSTSQHAQNSREVKDKDEKQNHKLKHLRKKIEGKK